jgi:hypothetical protein
MSENKSRVDSRKLKVGRCPAKLQVMGESISCRYNRSSETLIHPAEHQGEVILNDREGIIVTWQYWRVVKPPRL